MGYTSGIRTIHHYKAETKGFKHINRKICLRKYIEMDQDKMLKQFTIDLYSFIQNVIDDANITSAIPIGLVVFITNMETSTRRVCARTIRETFYAWEQGLVLKKVAIGNSKAKSVQRKECDEMKNRLESIRACLLLLL